MIDNVTEIRYEVERYLDRYLSEGKFKELWNGENPELIDDGILDVATWAKLEKTERILWLLKEHNGPAPIYGDAAINGADNNRMRLFGDMYHDGNGGVASQVGTRFKKNVNRFRTLKLIELASYAIQKLEYPSDVYDSVVSRAGTTYRQLCIVEVGKTPGGRKTPDKRLRLLCEAWGDIVRLQIKKYSPSVVISTGPQLEYLYPENERGSKSHIKFRSSYADRYCFDGRIWLRTYHPGYLKIDRRDWVCAIAQAMEIAEKEGEE